MNYKKAPCTVAIIAINVVVFIGLSFYGKTEDASFMLAHGAMYIPAMVMDGEYYRMFTSLFLHFGITHLGNNMLILFAMGWNLEEEMGKVKFVLIYLLSGLAGNVLSAFIDIRSGEYAVSAGASGAIFGVIGALLYIAIRNKGRVGNVTGRGIAFMIILSLYFGFTSSGVDNYAHIGGLLGGFLLAVTLYWKRNGKRRASSDQ